MKPTEILKKEHQLVLNMLKVMDAIGLKLESGQTVDPDDLADIIDFIRRFADGCHHAKEEKLLFVELEKAGLPRHDGPVAVMLREHEEGRHYARNMDEALQRLKNGDPSAAGTYAQNARGYIRLLANHIDKEDHVLFVMADQRLDQDAQKRLVEGFERVEREETGPDVHEKFHALLSRLQAAYL
ncbi:MAG TPA: hemerythrin domain-containing protein [Smithellaceae bacterium]|jgi:hemerythrin-like domain-containing protein|nr:hemerythrin domain-containing protein [Smithellaceae bacterium]